MSRHCQLVLFTSLFIAPVLSAAGPRAAEPPSAAGEPALIHADVVALDQLIVYNRFGSFDPYGMIFALRRDVSAASDGLSDEKNAADCAAMKGTEPGKGPLVAGAVRLKDCKRPRPLVLRARAGDVLRINLTNLLREQQPGISETFCKTGSTSGATPAIGVIRGEVSHYPAQGAGAPLCDRAAKPDGRIGQSGVKESGAAADFPRTRLLSFVVPGVEPIPGPKDNGIVPPACKGLSAIAPGATMTCHYRLDREGTHLFQSMAAPAGGEGDGGSLTHGLFGALIVEPPGSVFYRSQVPMAAFDAAWARGETEIHARKGMPDFASVADEKKPAGALEPLPANANYVPNPCDRAGPVPVAGMLRDCAASETITLPGKTSDTRTLPVREIVHGDINAIIVPPVKVAPAGDKPAIEPFREFVVIFHDELKTFYTKHMEALASFEQLSGIRDGFGINYGASGAGSLVLANRLKIGPSANCPECAYEEFFLESWANGDPALLENFTDDPSNVHHSYLNDRVVFRNFHAGPKETHVFHLHSHQWFAGNDKNRGAYLDSQTIGPQQGMSYDIYGGGASIYRPGGIVDGRLQKGWYDTLGSGNRNRTPGDAIFHCHLYPHFAQGMWELWRVHDVLEDGTRALPDGQPAPGLSLRPRDDLAVMPRKGTPRETGPALWHGDVKEAATAKAYMAEGTPIPGLLPVPRQAAPLLPTYDAEKGFPGYPFYIAGMPGHRAPQAPMDIAVQDGKRLDGGLGRHVITGGSRISELAAELLKSPGHAQAQAAGIELRDGVPYHHGRIVPITVAQKLALGDLTETYHKLQIRLLPPDGDRFERNAMAFHHQGLIEGDAARPLKLLKVDGTPAGLPQVPASALASDGGGDKEYGKATLAAWDGRRPDESDAEYGARKASHDARAAEVKAALDQDDRSKAIGYESILVPDGPQAPAPTSPEPGTPAASAERFVVNGGAPRPGAPFADPCAAPDGLRGAWMQDPYLSIDPLAALGGGRYEYGNKRPPEYRSVMAGGADKFGDTLGSYPPKSMTYDPGLSGFRRFEASVVQLDMIVNKAGWHDPQARINVLTSRSDEYKPGGSRVVSAKEEPFYFRAFSGDCIEFRHTNETPHKLDLDDFQAKVPTDTIGQHIHLVKFDVTSSDGSGNGFNYEDGTFAPDELKERIEASEGARDDSPLSNEDRRLARESHERWEAQCKGEDDLWKLKRTDNPACFQTTVQRWFADPILSLTGEDGKIAARVSDRTMRTVFSHDHFAPSNIQQHGFYNALLIEPARMRVRVYGGDRTGPVKQNEFVTAPDWDAVARNPAGGACTAAAPAEADYRDALDAEKSQDERNAAKARIATFRQACAYEPKLVDAKEAGEGVGARARVEGTDGKQDPYHPNYREFALAIADFALLYDGYKPSGAVPEAVSGLDGGGEAKGIDRLIGEAKVDYRKAVAKLYAGVTGARKPSGICEHNRGKPGASGNAERLLEGPETVPPAQAVACEIEEKKTARNWLAAAAVQLRKQFFDSIREKHGYPVYPPERPEAISQTHHDPYLVNYRTEPVPLRIGETKDGGDLLARRSCPEFLPGDVWEKVDGGPDIRRAEAYRAAYRTDHVSRQKKSIDGDMARVFRSFDHGDPCTPVFEAYSGERVMMRLIQGAQEVQHVFTVEGRTFRRNVDGVFSFAARLDSDAARPNGPTRWSACMKAAEAERPWQHALWFSRTGGVDPAGAPDAPKPSVDWLERYRTIAAQCDNVAGYVSAQEVGISEHFEMAGSFSSDSGLIPEAKLRPETAKVEALPVRDVLYHFGTVDAQWNGAWGILRTFNGRDTTDITSCLQAQASAAHAAKDGKKDPVTWGDCLDESRDIVGNRLEPLYGSPADVETSSSSRTIASNLPVAADTDKGNPQASQPAYPDLACPFISAADLGDAVMEPEGAGAAYKASHVFAALVAIEARYVRPENAVHGAPYNPDGSLYDPDALLFVPVSPVSIGLREEDILRQERRGPLQASAGDGAYGAIGWQTVRDAARTALADGGKPVHAVRPYVQRFNAGDCIHLVVVNALTETKVKGAPFGDMSGNHRDGLRDLPGDAMMPRITRLNTDQTKDGASDEQDEGIGEISGSASLAVAIPLSKMTNVGDATEPVGVNPRIALPPAEPKGDAAYAIETMFAGTINYDARRLDELFYNAAGPNPLQGTASCTVTRGEGESQKAFHYQIWPFAARSCDSGARLNVLGRHYCGALRSVSDEPVSEMPDPGEMQICVSRLIRQHVMGAPDDERDIRLRVVPRAYGVLPVKSASDPFSHAAHGLAGSLIVEPEGAAYAGRGEPVERAAPAPAGVAFKVQNYIRDETLTLGVAGVPAADWSWTHVPLEGNGPSLPQTRLRLAAVPLPEFDGFGDYAAEDLPEATLEEASLLWQDGLNLWDARRRPFFGVKSGGCRMAEPGCMQAGKRPGGPVPDCLICDDSYDHGEQAVSYGSNALFARLRATAGYDGKTIPATIGSRDWTSACGWPIYYGSLRPREPFEAMDGECGPAIGRKSDLSAWPLPADIFSAERLEMWTPVITAERGAEMLIRIVEPQGRARQRGFIPTGGSYHDVFPGFGSGHSALLAPGKGVTAAMQAPATDGDYLWFDGPRQTMSGGAWGLLRIGGAPSPNLAEERKK